MTAQDIYLKDTDSEYVDANKVGYSGGVVQNIFLQAGKVTYDVGVFTQVAPQPGKTNQQDHARLLSYGDFLGFANPTILVEGTINLNEYNETTGEAPTLASGALIATLKLLQQIYKSGHVFTMYDYFDDSTTTPIYRTHTLTGSFPAETITAMKVRCKSLSARSEITNSKEGARITYSLNLVEVRG